MSSLRTRGSQVAVVAAAALVVVIGLAAAGAFSGWRSGAEDVGRPSAAVTSSPHGGVAYATAKVLAQSVGERPADTWGDIHARELITSAFQQYGYFPLTQEFIARGGDRRVHSANIIAVKEGESAERLVVGAHYDSVVAGEGYTDNAGGVGLLLEVAARIKSAPTPYTVVFVALGAKEDGSLGAAYNLRSMSKVDREAVIGMIDLEAPAGGDELSVTSRSQSPAWLRDVALSAASELDVALVTSPEAEDRPAGTTATPGDDLPFADAGLPTAVFTAVSWEASQGSRLNQTADGSFWGTPRDTIAHVDSAHPQRVRRQLGDLSLLLETLLTSELKRTP